MTAIESLRNFRINAGHQIKEKLPTLALTGLVVFTAAGEISCAPESTDRIAPVITILGANLITIEQGTIYIDQGAIAKDKVDGDLTANIIVKGTPVETKTVGTKKITYIVYDRAGKRDTEKRLIKVIAPKDTTAPNK